jgi:hypothetical protein
MTQDSIICSNCLKPLGPDEQPKEHGENLICPSCYAKLAQAYTPGVLVQENDDPPTAKQLRYAKKLGIEVTPGMTKWDVSDLIRQMEEDNPELQEEREQIKDKMRERKYGEQTVAAEREWLEFSDTTRYMLAVYRHRGEIIVDVLRVNGAEINKQGKVVLEIEAPKGYKDPDVGPLLLWERYFRLPVGDLLYYEGLYKEFDDHHDITVALYRQSVEHGLRVAHDLRRQGKI